MRENRCSRETPCGFSIWTMPEEGGLPFDDALGASDTLVCGLTPGGRIDVRAGSPEDGPRVATAASRRILDAFEAGRGHGVLYLGAGMPGAELHPSLGYWRDFGRSFVTRVCGALDPTDPSSVVIPDPDPAAIAASVQAAPPMPGAELITPELLVALWLDVGEALAARAAESKGGVQDYLKSAEPGLERGRPGLPASGREPARSRLSLCLPCHLRARSLPAGRAFACAPRTRPRGIRRGAEPAQAAGTAGAPVTGGGRQRVSPGVGGLRRRLSPVALDTRGGASFPEGGCALRAGRTRRAHSRLVERQEPAASPGLGDGGRPGVVDARDGGAARLRRGVDRRRQDLCRRRRSGRCWPPPRVWR